jgi:two-component system cell cycle response regulator
MSVKILTVDDSKTIRLIVTKAFKPYDCTVFEANNGVVGLAVASREKPDVILLDYTMPVMDGFEVLARLRSDPDLKGTPVIMLTAEAGRDTVVKIAKLGVRDYLIKPFKEELLIERVSRVVTLATKSDDATRAKRFDDPIKLVIVDDKPAIVTQIKAGLEGTPWIVNSFEQSGQALDHCMANGADVVMVSLSMPKDGAYMLFQNLKGYANTSAIPVFGMSVKTATAEHSRAQLAGFAGVVSKPIDPEELKTKICRALHLETSYKYFMQGEGMITLKLPKELTSSVSHEISSRIDAQLTSTVESGGDKVVIDLNEVSNASLPVIELVHSAVQACGKLSLRHAVLGTPALKTECRSYEETQSWKFASNMEEALELLKNN